MNIASRMESNGLRRSTPKNKLVQFNFAANRVHLSDSSNRYLDEINSGYVTEPRGRILIKGKGGIVKLDEHHFELCRHDGDLLSFGSRLFAF